MCYFTDIAPNPELVDGYVKNTIIFNDISEECLIDVTKYTLSSGIVPKDYYIRQGEYINNHPTIDIFIKENEECDCFVSVEGHFISFEKNKAPLQILFTNTASTLSSDE